MKTVSSIPHFFILQPPTPVNRKDFRGICICWLQAIAKNPCKLTSKHFVGPARNQRRRISYFVTTWQTVRLSALPDKFHWTRSVTFQTSTLPPPCACNRCNDWPLQWIAKSWAQLKEFFGASSSWVVLEENLSLRGRQYTSVLFLA